MAVTLTIDGRPVTVEVGTTILQAAQSLGVEIPTLCHLNGVPPTGTCFLCVVQVNGRANLVPSCVAPVADGMEVVTDSADIRAARKMALKLLLSDHVGDCEAPCSLACPAGLDIAGMLRAIAAGDERAALAVAKERLPLAGSLGRICPRFCERVCRRRELDEPIAIRALHRFPADADLAAAEPFVSPRREPSGKRVAIVGAGPAGLSAAFFLLREGHACTLFDAQDEPGGFWRYAIPEFRLPRAALAGDIEAVRRLGAEFRFRVRLGADLALDDLRRDFDAVLLALGAIREEAFDFDGASLAPSALEFLQAVARGERPELGDHVLVLGGGNEATDAARTALRLGARVTLVWEGARSTMPAFGGLAEAAEAEGARLEVDANPIRLERRADGRFVLTCQRGLEDVALDAATVLVAPARRVDTELLEAQGVPLAKGRVKADRRTLATGVPGVFAAGECVAGPTAGVRAVAAGRLAALSIAQHLSGQPVVGETELLHVRLGKLTDAQKAVLFRGFPTQPRAVQPLADPREQVADFREVEHGLPPDAALREAARCLQCDCAARDACRLRQIGTEYGAEVNHFAGEARELERDESHPGLVYESGKCILCQLCTRISDQERERLGMALARRGFVTRVRVPFGKTLAEGLTVAAEGCAEACPPGALARKRRRE